MQPRLAPGRIYAQAISAWALLHPAVPLGPFCRKCHTHAPIGYSRFQPRLQHVLGAWRAPLGGSPFVAALDFGPMHLTWAPLAEIGAAQTACPLSRRRDWRCQGPPRYLPSWHSAAGKGQVFHSAVNVTLGEPGSRMLTGGMGLLGVLQRGSAQPEIHPDWTTGFDEAM